MDDFLFARSQMALSLAFHIIYAAVGIGMPLLMAISEGIYLRTGDQGYLHLGRRWATGTAILFAIGAVSGTVLSFELGLLWPGFMQFAGPVIGMPFSLEGFAFFTEAIFLGVYLYGWNRIPPFLHWLSGVIVAASGALSGVFVVSVNAWMNAPTGFTMSDGRVTSVDTLAAMLNPATAHQVLHMTLAAYVATGFAVAAVHAWFLLHDRTNPFHRRAFGIAFAVAAVAIPLQLASGDFAAKRVADLQPAKFAAMEGLYRTTRGAPLTIGGIPDDERMETRGGIEIPYGLSILADLDPAAEITGLEAIPRDQWPNTLLVHLSFDIMVLSGMAMLLVAAWGAIVWWRRKALPDGKWLLRALVAAGPLGFLAIETGWITTELGRQPWVIYGIMRTVDSVTPMTGLVVPFVAFTALYLLLSVILVFLLKRTFTRPVDVTGVEGAIPEVADADA